MTDFVMTERWLAIWLADEFHDWIDGDDSVLAYELHNDNSIDVEFEGGSKFHIQITSI